MIKNGLKVLVGYGISILIFLIFLYVFLSITKANSGAYLPYYTLVIFLLMFTLIYSDMKKLAEKEKKPQYQLNPYPFKGLIYGLIGFAPIVVLEIASIFIIFENKLSARLEEIVLNTLIAPMFFIVKMFGEKPLGYAAASLVVPAIAMFGYLAGYYGVNITKLFKKEDKIKAERPVFTKSPWNPTNKVAPAQKKKKPVSGKQAK